MNSGDKPLPYNAEVEKALLGACLLYGNGTFQKAKERITTHEMFHINSHRIIYKAMLAVYEDANVEPISVVDELIRKDLLEEAGGAAYVAQLSGDMATDANVDYHADIIEEDFHRRMLIGVFRGAYESLYDRNEDIYAMVNSIGKMELDSNSSNTASFVSEDTENVAEEIRASYDNPRSTIGVQTGLPFLDNMLSGMQNEDMIILAARPSQGKTALALQMAKSAQVPVYFLSREMSKRMLIMRMFASELGTATHELRAGNLSPFQMDEIESIKEKVSKYPIIIDEDTKTPEGIIRAARKAKNTHGIGLVIVDYLQLLTMEEKQTREREVANASGLMKDLAKSLKVPVLILSQLNRSSEIRADRPQLSDLRDSGAIEQDADVVIFLHAPKETGERPVLEGEHMIECIIAKQRNGPTGYKKIVFDRKTGRFDSPEVGKLGE